MPFRGILLVECLGIGEELLYTRQILTYVLCSKKKCKVNTVLCQIQKNGKVGFCIIEEEKESCYFVLEESSMEVRRNL